LAAGNGVTVAGKGDGGRKQHVERQRPTPRFRRFERQYPAADGARHSERGERPARRDGLVSCVELGLRQRGCRSRRHDCADLPRRLMDKPEAVAADVGHVRIDGGDSCGHGHHGLERVTALGENGATRLRRGEMRRADDAAAMTGAMQIHGWSA